MNTADIKKMTENNNTNNNDYSEKSILDIELEVLDEVKSKCSKNWYDRVYLCYEDTNFRPPNTYGPIKGFDCYRYNSFKNADIGWNNKTELHKLDVRHTMIPMCKWVPEMFDKYILNLKLRKMYWVGQIVMGRGYNKYK